MVEWSDVSEAAKLAFHVYAEQPELSWAEQAWYVLATAGLTSGDDIREEHESRFRLLALGGIYQDFSSIVLHVTSYRQYWYWAEPFDFEPRILRRLAIRPVPLQDDLEYEDDGEESEEDESERDDDADRDVLDFLVEEQRPIVVATLREELGGENQLYASLWRAHGPADHPFTSAVKIGDPRVPAYEWVQSGCPPR